MSHPYAGKQARINTTAGEIVVRFFPETAPNHVKNFCDLASKGFYNGVIFHRVIPGFMIQGGCPDGTGMGGPGYTIDSEFSKRPHKRGILSAARTSDPNSAGSQFFLMHADSPFLDEQYSVFGEIVTGIEVVDTIVNAPKGANDRPKSPTTMTTVTLFDA
jgi:cyclophilin family peptidyl-prolyl cis-trans isomerase